jgi:hypothetical protein
MFLNVGLFLHLAQILGLMIVRRTGRLLRCSIADGSSDDTAFFLAFPPRLRAACDVRAAPYSLSFFFFSFSARARKRTASFSSAGLIYSAAAR